MVNTRRFQGTMIGARWRVSGVIAVLVACLVGTPAPAARASEAVDHALLWKDAQASLFEDNRPLKALTLLETMTRTGGMHTSTLAQFHAVTGDLIGAESLAHAAVAQDSAPPAEPVPCDAWQRVPAVDAIVSLAADARVVMLNESHFVPLHRAFSRVVASRLRAAGFTHFGAETFAPDITDLVGRRGTPVTGMGVYSVEPVFGDLLRAVMSVGYTLFPYEQEPAQVPADVDPTVRRAAREQAQAANIHRLLVADAVARAVIHAGGGHVAEDPAVESIPMMGYRFKVLSGIDPITIDQIGGTPISSRKLQGALYRGVERCGAIVEPIVLRAAEGRHLARKGYDLTVFFPHTDYRTSRPDWLPVLLDRRLVSIRLAADAERTLVRVFRPDDPPDAVAIDQMLVPAEAVSVALAVPTGRHRLVREWTDGRQTELGRLEVPE